MSWQKLFIVVVALFVDFLNRAQCLASSLEAEFDFDHSYADIWNAADHDFIQTDGQQSTPEGIQTKIWEHFTEIDISEDGQLDKNELRQWLRDTFRNADLHEAKKMLEKMDTNADEQLSFNEYMTQTFGYSEEEIEQMRREEATNATNFISTVDDELSKFRLADLNKDGLLSRKELAAFQNPFHYRHMMKYSVEEMLREMDKDADRRLSPDEYISGASDNATVEHERKRFEEGDKNGDQFLDEDEIHDQLVASINQQADTEVEHLFIETDSNGDDLLSRGEVSAKNETWSNSQVIDQELIKDEL